MKGKLKWSGSIACTLQSYTSYEKNLPIILKLKFTIHNTCSCKTAVRSIDSSHIVDCAGYMCT